MNYRTCRVKHNPPESYGDCIRACVASIMDSDDVPHTFDGRPPLEAWNDLRSWLKPFNYTIFATHFQPEETIEDVFEFMDVVNPDGVYMLLCRTNGGDHCVVCRGGKKIHDPSMTPSKITAPPQTTGVYVILTISKI